MYGGDEPAGGVDAVGGGGACPGAAAPRSLEQAAIVREALSRYARQRGGRGKERHGEQQPVKVQPRHAAFAALIVATVFLGYRVVRLEQALEQAQTTACLPSTVPQDPTAEERRRPVANAPTQRPAAEEPADAGPISSAEARRKARLQMDDEDVAEYWEDTFAAEPVSPDWVKIGEQVRENIESALPDGAALLSFSCRSTLCRAEIRYADVYHHNELASGLFDTPSSMMNRELSGFMTGHIERNADNSAVVVMFLPKRGRAMTVEP